MIRLSRSVFDTARLYCVHSRIPACLVVILQGGHCVETVEAPEYCSFCWSYNKPFTNRLGVDVEQNSDGVHREKSKCESDQPGETFLPVPLDR